MRRTETHGDIVVHHPSKKPQDYLDEGYSISFVDGGWMPGVYDSIESAIRGGECCFIDVSRFVVDIQQPVNWIDKGARLITLSDMEGFE